MAASKWRRTRKGFKNGKGGNGGKGARVSFYGMGERGLCFVERRVKIVVANK